MRLLYLALDLKLEQDEAEPIHVREVVQNIAHLGHDVRVLVSRHSQVFRLNLGPRASTRPIGGGGTVAELVRVVRQIREFRPQAMYERRFLPKIAASASILTGVPAAVEINGLVEDEARMQGRTHDSLLVEPLRRRVHSAIFRRMRAVVAVTDGLASEMARVYRVPRDRIVVIENGANTSLFRPLDQAACKQRVGLDPARRWVCFAGSLNPWYDLPGLIESMKRVRNRDKTIALVVVGSGPRRSMFEDIVRDERLQSDVRFVGHVPYEEVPFYIGASDLCVAPLTHERNQRTGVSPIKVYEYVACGRPVVATRIPGIAEWIEKAGVGLLSEPHDPQDLADRILDVMNDEELKRRIAMAGPEIVRDGHSWSAVATRIATTCRRLVSS